MARFDIISKDGSIVRYSGKPRYNGSYLKPSFLEFSEIASPVPISWEVGDYVDYPRTGMRYRLYSIPQASKNARKDSHGRAFTYSNVQLHAATKELEIALFRDLVSNDNNIHFSTSPDVATFEDVYGIARRIQACMDDLYPSRWEIRVADFDESEDAEIIEKISEAKDFALSGGTCLDALSKIYELWQDIGWIHTYENGKEVITIGYANKRIADNTSDAYLYGKGNGLTAIKKNQTNKDEFATRLYVYGSERNLPSRYYNGLNILNAESVDIRNLMLPLDSWGQTDGLPDARKAYLENSDAVAKFGVIPKTHYFDSTDAGADIHPTIERLTIGEIRNAMSPDDDYYPSESYADTDRADAVLDVINPADDGVLKRDGKEYDAITYVGLQSVDKKVNVVGGISNAPIIINHPLFSKVVDTDFSRGKVVVELSQAITIPDRGYTSVSARVEVGDSEEIGYGASYGYMDLGATKSDDGKNWIIKLGRISVDYSKILYDTHKFPIYGFLTIDANTIGAESGETTIKLGPGSGTIGIKRVLDKTFNITLKQIGFDINEQASLGKGKTISMKTGACAGRNFVISDCFYSSANDSWVLTCKRQQDDTLGMLFPNNAYEIAGDDIFVLVDIAMPSLYIGVAMNRLLSEGQKFLARVSKIQSHYEPSIDAKVMAESGRTLREGMFMEITDEDVIDNTTEHILIDTLSIYEDESAIPTYKVTLRERRKVTYKGTPSATSTTSTKPVEEDADKEDIVVDLTNYYTKGEIDAKGYLTSDSLVGYAKTTEVAETYATKIALSAVDGRLVSLESYFSTSEDADTQINKWNEIVAFLNATEGTTLAGILTAYYTKTEVDNKVTTINNSITALDDKYAPVKTWYDALGSLIVKDGNNVRIKTNLIVEGDTASGGEGGSSSVGIQGIRLNGRTYYDITDGVEDGVIDLGTIGGGTITEITSEMITEALGYTPVNSASLGSLATKDSVAWSEITNVLTGGDEFNIIPSGHNGVFSFNHRAKDGGSATITEYRMRNGGGSYAPVRASSFIAHGGTSSQFLKADGSLDSTSYLSTSGGTLSSVNTNVLTLNSTINGGLLNTGTYLRLQYQGEKTAEFGHGWGLGTYMWANGHTLRITNDGIAYVDSDTLYHSGNFNPADYLPKAGGTITSSSHIPLVVESTASNNYVAIRLKSASTQRTLGIKSDGTLFVTNAGGWDSEYPILHSGNVGEYKAGDSDKLDGINSTGFALINSYPNTSDSNWNIQSGIYRTYAGTSGLPLTGIGNHVIHCNWDTNAANQLFLAYSKDLFSFRRKEGNVWQPWKTIAFTDSNVASATKLATARTIWGQEFDGTGDIPMTSSAAMRFIYFRDSAGTGNAGMVGRGGSDNIISLYTYTSSPLVLGTNTTERMRITNGGNVLIGTTTDAGYKLDVNGILGVYERITLYGGNQINGTSGIAINYASGSKVATSIWDGAGVRIASFDTDRSSNFYGAVTMESTLSVAGASTFNGKLTIDLGATQQALRVNGESTLNGSVSIIKALSVGGLSNLGNGAILGGTTRPSLDNTHSLGIDGYRWSILYAVDGNLSGNLIVSGDVASGSDVRFKDIVTYHRFKTEDIANAPLFTFRWNDRKDKAEHLGTSAQYWENVAPWLVKGEDFKTLDYATLGVAIGISLANKTMNHDERIKTLEKEIKTLRDEIRSIRHGIC